MNCTQPACAGEIVDGYCSVCGMAPARAVGKEASPAPRAGTGRSQGSAPSTSTTTRRSTGKITTGRTSLGAGLVEIPPVAVRDPATAVVESPTVAESKRFCASCGDPVGRARNGSPGRSEGFCPQCGRSFSFSPKLKQGDLVAGQYDVAGCLAHGGLGWVYLARDRNVSDRWVVLKGLLNSGDGDAMAAAVAERRFLAEVEHPNIVKIFNFVEHEGSGYIVMEYVGGRSLKQILTERREANGGKPDPLPVTQAIAYVLEILPALGYLHRSGLLFCDFKVDNVIQTQHSLKLIDLGGVYRMEDTTSPVYGTVGYQAPEIAETGPTIASDLFTVARTLAVLCIPFKGFQSTLKFTLPPADMVPLFERFDSLHRFLLKGTTPNADDRFQSADEMADQLLGVLGEVVAAETGAPVPRRSTVFTGDFRAAPDGPDWRLLPLLQVSPDDPAAGYLATLAASEPRERAELLSAAPERTVEVDLQLVRTLVDLQGFDAAEELLAEIEERDPWEWRAAWYRGLIDLEVGRAVAAGVRFTSVYHALPGELAPKLALGVAAESAATPDAASRWYDIVSSTDPAYTTATFGLARCERARGDRAAAIGAYDRVSESSSSYLDAQVAMIRCLLDEDQERGPEIADLRAASDRLAALPLDVGQRASLTTELLCAALELVDEHEDLENPDVRLAGQALTDWDLRTGLEQGYRQLARLASSRDERIRLVNWANQVRPHTWT